MNSSHPPTVSREEWLTARKELLLEEKEFTKQRERLSQRRRELPWVKVEQAYTFDSNSGRVSLAELFGKHSQLIIYHFMLGPGWEEGCKACSWVSDHFDATLPHLAARDVALAVVSHAPLAEINTFKQRMGWGFNWVSSADTSFNHDYHVSFTPEEMAAGKVNYNYSMIEPPMEELPGASVFIRSDDGTIHHTYSTYARGLDILIGTYNLLDLVPKGRNEDSDFTMSWVRHHDRYDSTKD